MTYVASGNRRCARCGRPEREHPCAGQTDPEVHAYIVQAGDEWCSECDDYVVNGCGSLEACEDEAQAREWDRENDAWLNERPWVDR